MPLSDATNMQRCLQLARLGEYTARPNPMVGAVVMRDERVLGEGWHRLYGQAHAEVNALEAAGPAAGGATLVVSLEPCSHWGKTPPCCEHIIAAGISRVVYGMLDPDPRMAGAGITRLREAGVEVVGPVLEDEALALNHGYVKRITRGLPLVRCKMAMSLDGRTAMASGESRWITGEAAREDVQKWRARSGAVVTGIETVLADDPRLNVRLDTPDLSQPLRVVVDSGLRLPARSRMLQLPGDILIATAVTNEELIADKLSELPEPRPGVISFAGEDGRVDLAGVMAYLAGERQCNDVLLESGARLAGAMLRSGLTDEIITYVAPRLLGSQARPLFDLPGMEMMAQGIDLEIAAVEMVGKDCRMLSRLVKPS